MILLMPGVWRYLFFFVLVEENNTRGRQITLEMSTFSRGRPTGPRPMEGDASSPPRPEETFGSDISKRGLFCLFLIIIVQPQWSQRVLVFSQLRYQMAHIWACPPSEGDDYIFHCHPVEQKIPKHKRLVDWYKKMLDKAIKDRVVIEYKVGSLNSSRT